MVKCLQLLRPCSFLSLGAEQHADSQQTILTLDSRVCIPLILRFNTLLSGNNSMSSLSGNWVCFLPHCRRFLPVAVSFVSLRILTRPCFLSKIRCGWRPSCCLDKLTKIRILLCINFPRQWGHTILCYLGVILISDYRFNTLHPWRDFIQRMGILLSHLSISDYPISRLQAQIST